MPAGQVMGVRHGRASVNASDKPGHDRGGSDHTRRPGDAFRQSRGRSGRSPV